MRLSLKDNRLDFLTEEISKQHGIQVTAQLLLGAFSHVYSKNWRYKQSRKLKNLLFSRKKMHLKLRSRKKQLLKRFMWPYAQAIQTALTGLRGLWKEDMKLVGDMMRELGGAEGEMDWV